MASSFKASLITPEAIVLETSIESAQVPAFDGLVGIMNHRAPLLARLGTGVLKLETTGGTQRFLVSGGYAQMKGEELTILTTEAIPAKQITQDMITAEQKKLDAVQGSEKVALEKRVAIQARITAMRSAIA